MPTSGSMLPGCSRAAIRNPSSANPTLPSASIDLACARCAPPDLSLVAGSAIGRTSTPFGADEQPAAATLAMSSSDFAPPFIANDAPQEPEELPELPELPPAASAPR